MDTMAEWGEFQAVHPDWRYWIHGDAAQRGNPMEPMEDLIARAEYMAELRWEFEQLPPLPPLF
jgi:hypothetical protein